MLSQHIRASTPTPIAIATTTLLFMPLLLAVTQATATSGPASQSTNIPYPGSCSCDEKGFVSKLKLTLTIAFGVVLIFEVIKVKLQNRKLLKKIDELMMSNTNSESKTKISEISENAVNASKVNGSEHLPAQSLALSDTASELVSDEKDKQMPAEESDRLIAELKKEVKEAKDNAFSKDNEIKELTKKLEESEKRFAEAVTVMSAAKQANSTDSEEDSVSNDVPQELMINESKEFMKMKERLAAVQAENEKISAQLNEKLSEAKRLLSDVEERKTKNDELRKKLEEAKEAFSKVEDEKVKIFADLAVATKEVGDRNKEIEELKARLGEAVVKTNKAESEIGMITNRLVAVTDKNETLSKELSEKNSTIEALRKSLAAAEEKADDAEYLRKELDEITAKEGATDKKANEVRELKKKLREAEKKAKEVDRLTKDVTTLKKDLAAANDKTSTLRAEKSVEIEELLKELAKVKRALKQKEEDYARLEAEYKARMIEFEEIMREKIYWESKFKLQEMLIRERDERIVKVKGKYRREQNAKIESETKLSCVMKKLVETTQKLADESNTNFNLKKQIDELNEKLAKASKELDCMTAESEKLKKELKGELCVIGEENL